MRLNGRDAVAVVAKVADADREAVPALHTVRRKGVAPPRGVFQSHPGMSPTLAPITGGSFAVDVYVDVVPRDPFGHHIGRARHGLEDPLGPGPPTPWSTFKSLPRS